MKNTLKILGMKSTLNLTRRPPGAARRVMKSRRERPAEGRRRGVARAADRGRREGAQEQDYPINHKSYKREETLDTGASALRRSGYGGPSCAH